MVRDKILDELKLKMEQENLSIKLAIILVGNNEASKIYIKNKEKACNYVGIDVEKYILPEDTEEQTLLELIKKLNADINITGIILQSPVPEYIDYDKCSNLIDAKRM